MHPPVPTSWEETVLHSFDYSDGAYNTYAGLVSDAAGNLYGTTQSGGKPGCNLDESCGVVFELLRVKNGSWKETVLYSFSASDRLGFWPRAGLTVDAKGRLYGTTSAGGPLCSGSVNCGTVFELLPGNGTWSGEVLHAFGGRGDGTSPEATLVFDAGGHLLGTTAEGGNRDDGIVFELTHVRRGPWTERTLHSFNNREGEGPAGALTSDNAGNVYGATGYGGAHRSECGGYGCGTAFELKPRRNGAWSLAVLHDFGTGTDGAYPVSALTRDSAGNLFGVTAQGGARSALVPRVCLRYGCGTVFELTHENNGKWSERIVHDFGIAGDGYLPRGDLIFDESGALYGTTVLGGGFGFGNAFRLVPHSGGKWNEEILHDFGQGKDGAEPYSGMIFDQNRNLYGTTASGGHYRGGNCKQSHGCGTVFEITPDRHAIAGGAR